MKKTATTETIENEKSTRKEHYYIKPELLNVLLVSFVIIAGAFSCLFYISTTNNMFPNTTTKIISATAIILSVLLIIPRYIRKGFTDNRISFDEIESQIEIIKREEEMVAKYKMLLDEEPSKLGGSSSMDPSNESETIKSAEDNASLVDIYLKKALESSS